MSELAGRVRFYGDPEAETALIQCVDEHDLEGMDEELRALRALTDAPFSLAAVRVADWNRDLSPWEAPPVFGRTPFGGGAAATLEALEREALPALSRRKKLIGGYSLAGLFALWAACESDAFDGVAAASPSVWFPGWAEYRQGHPLRAPLCSLSLGDREEKARNPVLARVGDALRKERAMLEAEGVRCALEWNNGNHFQDAPLRTAKAFAWLLNAARVHKH